MSIDICGEFAKPTVDVAFRHILSDSEVAISLINGMVPELKIREIQRGPEVMAISPKRDVFMDFHARTVDGGSVIIEMQAKRHVMFDERSLFYAAYTFSHQFAEHVLQERGWYEEIKPVYAIQLLDYETNMIRGLASDLDKIFIEEINAHPMPDHAFVKHYLMIDRVSGQEIKRGIHLIQIELPRAVNIMNLSPSQEGFSEKSQNFTLTEWWCCVLEYASQFRVEDFEKQQGQFKYMPKEIYHAFEMLKRETWGADLGGIYEREALDISQYSTMIAANHHQGLHEGIEIGRREGLEKGRFEGEIVGQIKSLMERFVDDEDMERALRRIAKNSLARNLVERVWADCGEARIIPENKHVEDFIAILQNAGVLT